MSRILLVRHGQASFHAEDYDVLSPTGVAQSRALGEALAARGVVPDVVVTGQMTRHAQTAAGVLDGAAWGVPVSVDAGWDELDHLGVLAGDERVTGADETAPAAFQRWFEGATLRWTGGAHDASYDETFGAFCARVSEALERLTTGLARGATAVVLTSGGPVAWVAACLLADGEATRTGLWHRLNPVSVNTGVSTVVVGRRGTTLVTWNAHDHLTPDLLTYR